MWSGVSRLQINDRGQRRFSRLDNVYVSQDGSEIRHFPGFGTFIDLTEINNPEGYARDVPEAVRPVMDYVSPNAPYVFPKAYDPSDSQTLYSRAKPSSFFGFEQIGNEILILGESRFREQPIYDSSRVELKVQSVTGSSGVAYVITMDGSPASNSLTDGSGAGLNGLRVGDIVYFDNLIADLESDQDQLNSDLVGQTHEVDVISGQAVTLATVASGTLSTALLTLTGEMRRVRSNRNDNYTTSGIAAYSSVYDDRPDDPDALTCWRISAGVDMLDPIVKNLYPCYPSWVANRQRDFGDQSNVQDAEGIILHQAGGLDLRGASRREQRRLPFRPNIEPALDRILIAAPQYGCMFQVPTKVPIDPEKWTTASPSMLGLSARNNGVYDRPRALGIPKPRLIDSFATPAMASPSDLSGSTSACISARFGSPDFGLDSGEYKLAISFEDSGTGDEGLASETITINIPLASSSNYAYTARINYIHPGYHFPECMALKMNVYLATPGSDALAFYGQFELARQPSGFGAQEYDLSSHFGTRPVTPTEEPALFRSFDLPLLSESGDLSSVLDSTRLAPQSASMPRGAEACKYIRGVLFSGGALGNAGPQNQLWKGTASSRYAEGSEFWAQDELHIRAHSLLDASVPSSSIQDGGSEDSTLGTAGRSFPDAYQGIDAISADLYPGDDAIKKIDKVKNRQITNLADLENPTFRYHHTERIKLEREVWNRGRVAGASPSDFDEQFVNKPIHYVMPRGQVQIGDPGLPNRASAAFIKLIDPNQGDDISAIGHLNGSAIICTRRETYTYSWYRNPAGEEANLMSKEFGCIASNSMVEFDGGLAWLSDRGPVALGQGLQHVGADIAEDFYGQDREYVRDSSGMMRHSWSVHDASRGLVMWGLLRRDSSSSPRSLRIEYEGATYSVASSPNDEILSRFPCDEVLIWSYRANAFSHWRPPVGLEIYWMRPLRDKSGIVRMCFLAADGRIYALDDAWSDSNSVFNGGLGAQSNITTPATNSGKSSTTLRFKTPTFKDGDTSASIQRNFSLTLREGMIVEVLDDDGTVVSDSTIASITSTTDSSLVDSEIELSGALTWSEGQSIRIACRQRAKIVSHYIGAETMDTMQVHALQMRYGLKGSGHSNVKITAFKSEPDSGAGEEAREIDFTNGMWAPVGKQLQGTSIPSSMEEVGFRKSFECNELSNPEVAFSVEVSGEAQLRIQDLGLEVG